MSWGDGTPRITQNTIRHIKNNTINLRKHTIAKTNKSLKIDTLSRSAAGL
jgi:hypothetical protein